MQSKITLSLIVARASNGCIGQNNSLPWHLPNDLKYFKQVTLGKPIIMGRKTWESLKGPLPGRTNIIISRQHGYAAAGAEVVASLDDAIALANRTATRDGATEALIIGGAEIYRHALEKVQRMYVTEVHAQVHGDAFFADVDASQWQQIECEDFIAEPPNIYDYSFIVYQRRDGTDNE